MFRDAFPASEGDDSRLSLWHRDGGIFGHTAVLGAKIDTVFDVLTSLGERAAVAGQ